MDKKTKKASLFLLLFVVLVISLSAVSATSSNSSQWPQQADNNQNTGQSPYLGPQDNTTKWNHTFSENDSIATGPVVGRDGTVYIGTNYHPPLGIETINNGPGSAGTLHAFNRDGSVKWTYTLSDGISNYIHETPTIGPDGTIYLVTRFYDGTDNFGNLYAIKDGGSSAIYKWNFTIPGNSSQITGSPIIGQDGTIYFGTHFNIDEEYFSRWIGNFYALNPNGTLKWNYSLSESFNSEILNNAALGSDGTIYFNILHSNIFSPNQAELYALKDMGTYASKKWLFGLNYGLFNALEGSPVIGSDGTIYVSYNSWAPVWPYSFSGLLALIDNGTEAIEKWIYDLPGAGDITSSPALSKDGTIYFGASEEGIYNLYAIQDLGTSANKKWNFTTTGGIRFAPIIGNDGTIYFGDGRLFDTFFALDKLGNIKWSYQGAPVTEAAMAQDGTIYFGLGEDRPQVGLQSESEIMSSTATLIAIKGPPANLYVKTTVDNPNPDIGDIVTVTFKVGNDGPNTAYNTILTYVIPKGMKFIKAWADVGTISYNPVTKILTWDIGDVPIGDPIAHIQMLAQKAGKFPVDPEISTSSDDPNLSSRIENAEITVQAASSDDNNTIGMQHTGLPLAALLLAMLMVIGGSLMPKKKRLF